MQIDTVQYATATLLIGAGTLALRASFIMAVHRGGLPPRLLRALGFLPAAMFAALVVASLHPERVLLPGDPVQLRLPALLLASFVALRTRSILWTLVSGMAALWLLGWILAQAG